MLKIISLFNVEYNTNSYNKNYNIANNFKINPRQHVYCFDCKIVLRAFIFNYGSLFPRVDYGVAIKLQITYVSKVT